MKRIEARKPERLILATIKSSGEGSIGGKATVFIKDFTGRKEYFHGKREIISLNSI